MKGQKTGGRKAGTPNKASRGFLEAQGELQKRFDAALQKKHGAGTKLDALIDSLVTRGINGDSEAIRVIMDRWAGRPRQSLDLEAGEGTTIQLVSHIPRPERDKPAHA